MAALTCPICFKPLTKQEGLYMTEDTHGDVVIWHMIPKEIPTNLTGNPEDLVKALNELTPKHNLLPGMEMRTYCGVAGNTVKINP